MEISLGLRYEHVTCSLVVCLRVENWIFVFVSGDSVKHDSNPTRQFRSPHADERVLEYRHIVGVHDIKGFRLGDRVMYF